jgi:hypothetical protein
VEDFNRLGRLQETMLRLWKDGAPEDALTIWRTLEPREQQMLFSALLGMVNHLRAERGDPPDAIYGPPELEGL